MRSDTFPQKESKFLELKEKIPSKSQLIKTCVAFANGAGGQIVIGVQDKTLRIIGVSDEERDRIFEEINNSIYDSIMPTIIPEIYEQNVDDKSLVIIKVYPGMKPPYFVKSEGNKKGVYLRVGASNRLASDEYIEDLLRHQRKTYFDEESSGQEMSILVPELIKEVYGKHYKMDQLITDKIVIRDVLNPKKMYTTNTGVLFFTSAPELYIPESIVICTHFKGTKGRGIIRTTELNGPIPHLVDSILALMSSWLETDLVITSSGKMKGKMILPIEALREGIINALVHRKYFIPGAIKLALFEDRLEIFSPGSFPGLISVEGLGDGTTFLRNPHIAKIARKLKLIEKLGSGIKLIFDLCAKEKLRQPVYSEDGDFVKLIFYFEKAIDLQASTEDQIIQLGEILRELTIHEITERLQISRNTATRKLNILIKNKIFERKGKGPGTIYYFKKVRSN